MHNIRRKCKTAGNINRAQKEDGGCGRARGGPLKRTDGGNVKGRKKRSGECLQRNKEGGGGETIVKIQLGIQTKKRIEFNRLHGCLGEKKFT